MAYLRISPIHMAKRLRVAMVAPPFGQTGGPEVVVQNLTDALLDLGVDVTLFAPGDWQTRAKHVPTIEKSIWNMEIQGEDRQKIIEEYRTASQMKVLEYQGDFDLVHLNSQDYAYPVASQLKTPAVLTLHNNIGEELFEKLDSTGIRLVVATEGQKKNFAISSVIHHGVPVEKIAYSYEKGGYLMFVGRLADQKGVDIAIQIAKRAGKKLYIFGRKGNTAARKKYFDETIAPYLDGKQIVYKGEVSHGEIYEFMRGAEALLFPIRRPEVFGMVSAEALACGTPVIGSRIRPLPELLHDGEVAFLADDIEELVVAARNVESFKREKCRQYAQDNFDSSVMARKYLALYEEILDTGKSKEA